ncbi:MAG: Gfo/Idh/MocA family oxidoreductase [Bacteroidetes bacterium]|nr:Gfo/Idh/MocA family oxidoreductase [Bacteroidota bacterium]
MQRKIRMGMIGGGAGAFIGAIHRMALNMDGLIELCCGAFSSNPDRAKDSGKSLFLPEERVYASFEEMILAESKMPPDKKIDFISIVTPNHEHFRPAMLALENGFHLFIEKPITYNLIEALQLREKLKEKKLLLCLAHTYSGYPMVKQARAMIAENQLGKIRKVVVLYPQGWLSNLSEKEGNAQAAWRTDPSKSGLSGCMGDIGTHAAQLAEYISGEKISAICASLNIVVDGRKLDDDGNVLCKFKNGASGILMATQIAAGENNDLSIQVYGEKGGIEWKQENPNQLMVKWKDKPVELLFAGTNFTSHLSSYALHNCRTPAGHPEGYIEAFANLYRNFALTISAGLEDKEPSPEMLDFPGIEEGIRGMAFIENVVFSSGSSDKWMTHIVP